MGKRKPAEGGEKMKRILVILTVALLMVVVTVVMAAPSFGDSGRNPGGVKIGQHSSNPHDGNGKVR